MSIKDIFELFWQHFCTLQALLKHSSRAESWNPVIKILFIVVFNANYHRILDEYIKSRAVHLIKSWFGLVSVNNTTIQTLLKYDVCIFCVFVNDAFLSSTHTESRVILVVFLVSAVSPYEDKPWTSYPELIW